VIVVDTNTIAYLTIGGPFTALAREVYVKDSEWAAPMLWRSEYRNVIALYLRKGLMRLDDALRVVAEAELMMAGREYTVDSPEVLQVVQESGLSAYDSEFVALAKRLRSDVVTTDDRILKAYPTTAFSLEQFTSPGAP
jgi:predicted nucleic acid-binding protein